MSHSAENFVGGSTFLCCVSENFWQRKSFEKEGEGVLKVSVEIFLSHSAENFVGGSTFLCCVSENFWQRKSFEKEGEGVLKVSVEIFLSHSAENFVGGSTFLCCVSENFWQRKSFEKEGERVSRFFCLTVLSAKILLGDQLCFREFFCAAFQKISGSEKVLKKRGRGKEY